MTRVPPKKLFAPTCIALAIVVSLWAPHRAEAQRNFSITTNCSGLKHLIDLGSVLMGGQSVDTVSIKSGLPAADTVSFVKFRLSGDKSFGPIVDSVKPFPDSTVRRLMLTFVPIAVGADTAYIYIDPTADSGCRDTILIVAKGVNATRSGDTLGFVHSAYDIISFSTDKDSTITVNFRNNTGLTYHFAAGSVSLEDTTNFHITQPSKSDSVPSGQSFSIGLTFKPSKIGFLSASLIVRPIDPPFPMVFSIQGLYLPPSSVTAVTRPAGFVSLYPNPSHGEVTIHSEHLTQLHATISDVLGRRVREASFSNDWNWDAHTSSGAIAPAGIYFITVTGIDEMGKQVSSVVRIILD